MRLKKAYIIWGIVLLIILIAGYGFYSFFNKPITLSYNQFIKKVHEGQIQSVYLTDSEQIKGKFKNGNSFITDNPRKMDFKEELLKNNIKVYEKAMNAQVERGFSFLFSILLFGSLIYVVTKTGTRQKQSGFSKYTSISAQPEENININFDNIAGNEEAKDSVKELVNFIKNPEKFARYGARMPRGIIFYGPPGTGKTLMAKALAGEAGVPFYAVSGSDFVQVYVGVGAGRIRDLFKKAKQHGKCVIFIDEIDALGKKRDGGTDSGGNDERDQTLNALLAEMSGFGDRDGIVVIAATNRLDILDEALLRPGRFDRHIEIGLPDVTARHAILKLHSQNKLLSNDIDLKKVAYQTVYFSGAKLENMMNEAAIFAAMREAEYIEMCDIDKAFYTVIAGSEKKDRKAVSVQDKKITAVHEAGHALVTKLVAPENRVSRITIIPSTKGIGGFSMNIPPDRMHYSKKNMENNIRISLAGRAAEELVFGEDNITSGASNDIEKATDIITTMLKRLGMNKKTGLINYDVFYRNSYHGESQDMLNECKMQLGKYYSEVISLLKENSELLNEISMNLIEKETMDEETLDNILKKHKHVVDIA